MIRKKYSHLMHVPVDNNMAIENAKARNNFSFLIVILIIVALFVFSCIVAGFLGY
jgi:hypothetical protein